MRPGVFPEGKMMPADVGADKMAMTHRSVLASRAPREVFSRADGLYIDATFGRGGHTRGLLGMLGEKGRVIAFDRDPEAVAAAKGIHDPRFLMVHAPFSCMAAELAGRGIGFGSVSGILMDIGVSSPQIDDASRGFSFRMDGPLDMRMDTSRGLTAAQWLEKAGEDEIRRVVAEYGEERFASRIAREIVRRRGEAPLRTTRELADLVASAVPRGRGDTAQHPATRTFQAIRIHVNGELDELRDALPQAVRLLEPGGKLAVISFHSLEDRIVKRFFFFLSDPARGIDPRLPIRARDLPPPLLDTVGRIRPDAQECEENPRARSATLRVARRTGAEWNGRLCAAGAEP